MELVRKIAAMILGILILVAIVLAAKWTGERIREKFFPVKPVTPVVAIPAGLTQTPEELNLLTPEIPATVAAKYKKIPSTGPELVGLVLLGSSLLGGLKLRKISS